MSWLRCSHAPRKPLPAVSRGGIHNAARRRNAVTVALTSSEREVIAAQPWCFECGHAGSGDNPVPAPLDFRLPPVDAPGDLTARMEASVDAHFVPPELASRLRRPFGAGARLNGRVNETSFSSRFASMRLGRYSKYSTPAARTEIRPAS